MPEWSEEKLIKELESLRTTLSEPDLALLRTRVMAIVRAPRPKQSARFPLPVFLRSRALVALILIIVFVLGVGGGTVAAAQNDLPHEALYGVKLWSEDVWFRLHRAPESRLALLENFSQRRIEELDVLLLSGPEQSNVEEQVTAALERMTGYVEQAGVILAALEDDSDRLLQNSTVLAAHMSGVRLAATALHERFDGEVLAGFVARIVRVHGETLARFEDAERRASPEGLEGSAEGLLRALEEKYAAVRRMYTQLVGRGAAFSEQVQARFADASTGLDTVRSLVSTGIYREAFIRGKDTLFLLIEVERAMHLSGATPAITTVSVPQESSTGETTGVTAPEPTLEVGAPRATTGVITAETPSESQSGSAIPALSQESTPQATTSSSESEVAKPETTFSAPAPEEHPSTSELTSPESTMQQPSTDPGTSTTPSSNTSSEVHSDEPLPSSSSTSESTSSEPMPTTSSSSNQIPGSDCATVGWTWMDGRLHWPLGREVTAQEWAYCHPGEPYPTSPQ